MFTNYITLSVDLERFGVTLPRTVLTARAVLTAARDAAAVQPVADLATDYASGKVTPTNVAAKMLDAAGRLAARDNIQQALNAVESGCNRTILTGLRDEGEKILKSLREPFNEAAAVVQTAGLHFGSDPTAEQVIAGGVPAVAAHEHLGDALNTLSQLRSLRVALADCGYGTPEHSEQDVTWWIVGADDADALDTARRAYTSPGHAFHNLAAAGFTLRMNTPKEADRVAAGARAATEAREEAEREAQLKEHRESWAPALDILDTNARKATR